jgi:uncharacterized protein YkwD
MQKLINKYRGSIGVGGLKWDWGIHNTLVDHNINSMNAARISHDNFGARVKKFCPKGCAAGENVASNCGGRNIYAAIRGGVTQWKNSSGHDKNMRNPAYTRGGLSVVWKPVAKYGSCNYFAHILASG